MAELDDTKKLANVAFEFYPIIFSGEKLEIDPQKLAERMKRIHSGLNPEAEFFAIASWLGNSAAIHRIDQTPMPIEVEHQELRAPDFLAIVRYKGRLMPMLIEVKSTSDDRLEWSESYLNSLKRFAQIVNLPLLVAWKYHDLWLLADHIHFQKKVTAYHLTLERAGQENLMSQLFGDVSVQLSEKFVLALDATLVGPKPSTEGLLPPGEYTFHIEEAGFEIEGKRVKKLAEEYTWLFFAAPEENEIKRVSHEKVRIVLSPRPRTVFPLFHVLITRLLWTHPSGDELNWNAEIRKRPLPLSGRKLREALSEGIDMGIVKYVFHQEPHAIPKYLESS